MGLFNRALKAATGTAPLEAVIERCIAEARQRAAEGLSTATLVVTQADIGVRNTLSVATRQIVASLQDAGIAVLGTEGGSGWDRVLRLHVDPSGLRPADPKPPTDPTTARRPAEPANPANPAELGAVVAQAPATLSVSLRTGVDTEPQDIEGPAKLEVCDGGIRVRTPHRVAFEARYDELEAATYCWVLTPFGRVLLCWEVARRRSDGQQFIVQFDTNGPGLDDNPTPAGICVQEIRGRTALTRWRLGEPTPAQLLPDSTRDSQDVPAEWVPAVPLE